VSHLIKDFMIWISLKIIFIILIRLLTLYLPYENANFIDMADNFFYYEFLVAIITLIVLLLKTLQISHRHNW